MNRMSVSDRIKSLRIDAEKQNEKETQEEIQRELEQNIKYINSLMTVEKLIKHLKKIPKDTHIVFSQHMVEIKFDDVYRGPYKEKYTQVSNVKSVEYKDGVVVLTP